MYKCQLNSKDIIDNNTMIPKYVWDVDITGSLLRNQYYKCKLIFVDYNQEKKKERIAKRGST